MSRHFQIHVDEMRPADVSADDGWQGVDIRFLVSERSGGAEKVCFWRTVFRPGTAHARHYHPNAEEVFFILRGWGAAGTEAEEHEVGPGTAILVPTGVTHWFRNVSDTEELELVGCYCPATSLEDAGYVYVGEITDEYRQVPSR
jgi:mannose-6-phosphate isomerase-like protein (cupin superfamily)